MNEKYINAADCAEFFYEHLDDNGMRAALNAIEEMPAADVKPVKHGRWIETNDTTKKRCSGCDVIHLIAQYPHGNANYCPNCGAKMDGDTTDEP